jgi:two-component system, NarL family, sensor kinase
MKKLLFFSFLLLSVLDSHAQTAKRDSLLNQLAKSRPDTNKVLLLFAIGDAFEGTSPDTARHYIRQARELSSALGYTKGVQKSYRHFAYTHVLQTQYDSLLYYSELGLKLARQNQDTFNIGVSLFNMGTAYRFMSDYENAIAYNLEGARLLEGKGYTNIESSLYDGLQNLYLALAQYDKAILYGEKAAGIGRTQADKNPLAVALNNLALSYIETSQLDKAKAVLNEAVSISRSIENKSVEGAALNNLADIAILEGRIELLKDYGEKSLGLHRDINSLEGIAISKRVLAIYYLQQKDFNKANSEALEALKINDENNLFLEKSQCLKTLSSIAFARLDFTKGQQYLQQSQRIDGEIFNESVKKMQSSLNIKYETEKRERKIDELESEKKINLLAMRQRAFMNYILLGAIVTLITISLLAFRNYSQKRKLQQQRINELETEKQLTATEAVLKGEEQERSRLAKDLHDGLGGMLSGIKYSFNNMKGNLVMTPENHQAFERSMDMLDSSIKEMRRVAHNMMPESLVRFGLDTALKDFCKDIDQSGAVQVKYQSIGVADVIIEQTTSITLYRIVQELLHNTLKHAAARTAIVQLTKSGNQLSVTVEDDGKGFDPTIVKYPGGMGWSNIRHRVDFLKGKLDLDSQPGKGTSVHIEFEI